jgi:hypothetical protein
MYLSMGQTHISKMFLFVIISVADVKVSTVCIVDAIEFVLICFWISVSQELCSTELVNQP